MQRVRPTPYPDLNSVLDELVSAIQGALRETFVAACLQGSFALGDFDRHSDVDFIIVVADELTDAGIRVQAVEARASVRDRLRSAGADGRLGGINRFNSVADVLDGMEAAAAPAPSGPR